MSDGDSISIPAPAERYCVIYGVEIRKVTELEPIEIAFLVFANISLLLALAMAVYRIYTSVVDSLDYVFAVLLTVNLLFVIYYIFHGVFMERPYEILVSLLTLVIVMVYVIADFSIAGGKTSLLKKVRLGVICVLGPVDIGLGIAVAAKFFEGPGNLMFRLVGANVLLQSVCKKYFIFTAFIGFDFQIVLILLVLILFDEPSKLSLSERLIIAVGASLSAICVIIGRIGARIENTIMSFVFLSFCVAEPAYIIYLFNRFGMRLEQATKQGNKSKKILSASVIAAGVVGLAVRLILVILAFLVFRNFGKGLKAKQSLQQNRLLHLTTISDEQRSAAIDSEVYPSNPNPGDVYQKQGEESPPING